MYYILIEMLSNAQIYLLNDSISFLGIVSALPMGVKIEKIDENHTTAAVSCTIQNDKLGNKLLVIENSELRAQFHVDGTLVSLIHKATGRESIDVNQSHRGANHFVLFEDLPFFWDAWDVFVYHTEKRFEVAAVGDEFNVVEQGTISFYGFDIVLNNNHYFTP